MSKQKWLSKMFEGLDSCIERAPALFSHPVLYDKHVLSQDEHSETVKRMLKTNLIVRWGRCFKFTDEPKLESYFAQHDLDVNENLHGSSMDIDKERAKIKAIGECLERLSLIYPRRHRFINATFREIVSLGEDALDPGLCMNFSESYLPLKSIEYLDILRTSHMRWVIGKNLIKNKPAFIPYQLVFLPTIDELEHDPLIRVPITTGTACGDGFEDAVLKGIMECIERDSNMLCWLTKKDVPRVILDLPLFMEIEKYTARYNLELYVWDLTSDIGIPSMMAIVINRTGIGPAISAGTKADLDPKKAVIGAIYEALHCRFWIRSLYQKKQHTIKAEDVIDLPSRGFYWYRLDMIKQLDFLMNTQNKIMLSEIRDLTSDSDRLVFTLNILTERGISAYATDITLPQIKEWGFAVVRTVLPELHPMHLDEDMPYYYSQRLAKHKQVLNKIPAPFL